MRWKIGLALLLAAPAPAALPGPPDLPFALPAAGPHVRQTTTLYAPGEYAHIAVLDRPLAEYELDDFAAGLARGNWTPLVADAARGAAVLRQYEQLAPTPELRQPFDVAGQLLQGGLRAWTIEPVQLLYAPGENASLCITFPLPANDLPAGPGAFTADLPLPLPGARFDQAAIQAERAQITRMETWQSFAPPELVFDQAEPLLVAAGWTPLDAPAAPAAQVENAAARARVLAMESILRRVYRVYHRGTSQLTVFHAPAGAAGPDGLPHAYTFMLRTLLEAPEPAGRNLVLNLED